MASENDRAHEKSPVTRMQPFGEIIKTPGGEASKISMPVVPITVEKTSMEDNERTRKTRELEEGAAVKEYEAFKKFQMAPEKYKETKKKKEMAVDEQLSSSSEDERRRRKMSRKKKGKTILTSEESEEETFKKRRTKKKDVESLEESEEERPKRRKKKKVIESSEESDKGQWKRIKIPKHMGVAKSQKRREHPLTPEAREARRYNKEFEKLNFRSPFTDDINETPVPKGLKGPRIKMYDGTGDPDDHVSNFQWAIKMIPMNAKLWSLYFAETLDGSARLKNSEDFYDCEVEAVKEVTQVGCLSIALGVSCSCCCLLLLLLIFVNCYSTKTEFELTNNSQQVTHLLSIPMTPNAANMCATCLLSKVDITERLQNHITIVHCPECESYLQPPRTWIKTQLESKQLLTFCLKRLTSLNELRLTHAEFVWTEPHSKRIKVRLKVQKEVLNGVVLEQTHVVNYTVHDRICQSCSRVHANPDQWVAVVQLRQQVAHRRTFFYLEQLILKHDAALKAIRIKQINHGIDFFFANRSHAWKFLVEYVVLDVKLIPEVNGGGSKYSMAEVEVARVSDFGKNDRAFLVRSHLGGVLKPGDFALGYDLQAANINDMELEKYKCGVIPEVVLVKKREERRKKKKMNVKIDGDKMIMKDEYEKCCRDLEENLNINEENSGFVPLEKLVAGIRLSDQDEEMIRG
ncbi:hypothetical protein LXL04_017489 [Taraxacum kok-saghyz]